MHNEKNVTDSVLGTLLGTDRKNQNTYNDLLDCVHLGIKKRLQPKSAGDRPSAGAFNLKNDEKKLMCEVFASSKLPDGLASNISRTVGTVGGFNSLSCRIAIVLCMLEHLMPPAFFDIMVHLSIHLADEVAIAGPVHFRWMFPIERFLVKVKKYVHNKARQGSIAEGYIVEEFLDFCDMYLGDTTVAHIKRPGCNADAIDSGKRVGLSVFTNPRRPIDLRFIFPILMTKLVVDSEFVERKKTNRGPRISAMVMTNQANTDFLAYFDKLIDDKNLSGIDDISDDFLALVRGPNRWARRWTKHNMNGFRFHVKSIDGGKT
ncbi:hypothetical protein M0R45_006951 [Rubus argutus]|uniref:DUF4218 domain-containing protein n=1 Tax=Rubus argutus TaxID=59490 RepID=A0AAW1YS54_RUBAR